MASGLALAVASLTVILALASAARISAPSEIKVVEPEIVVPGEWQTDKAEKYLFLPLAVPKDIKLKQCKVMTNGESLLIVVTETPEAVEDTNAMRKYKMLVEALKSEVGGDEHLLQSKLQEWLDTEEDDEVRVLVESALRSLEQVQKAKENDDPRSLNLRLGLAQHASFLGRNSTGSAVSLPAVQQQHERKQHKAGIIKESFAVEIPYPVPQEKLFIVQTNASTLMVGMPLIRESLEASGVSTGGKPFTRVSVLDAAGTLLVGPIIDATALTQGLSLDALGDLLPLTEWLKALTQGLNLHAISDLFPLTEWSAVTDTQ